MAGYEAFHRHSIKDRAEFWREQARLIDWQTEPKEICHYYRPPFAKWYVGGMTRLCHNALDDQVD